MKGEGYLPIQRPKTKTKNVSKDVNWMGNYADEHKREFQSHETGSDCWKKAKQIQIKATKKQNPPKTQ